MTRWISVALFVMILLSGCDDNGGSVSSGVTLDQQLGRYQSSLRSEADWLWDHMTYTYENPRIDAARCTPKTFDHQPVILDQAVRADDQTAGKLVDHLDYAAPLIQEAHAQWDGYCQGNLSAVNVVAFIQSRLQPAYSSLNVVESTLIQRGLPTPTPIRIQE